MKIIPVKIKNKLASVPMLVDDWDYEILKVRKWSVCYKGYANARFKGKNIQAHRVIIWRPDKMQIDHIDGNRLNNQKKNLRICSQSENQRNRGRASSNTSGFKGVSWHKCNKKWRAVIGINNRLKHLGSFNTPEEAHEAYKQGALKYHGDYSLW